MNLRRLNDEGLRRFRDYIESLNSEPSLPPPFDLLENPKTSESASDIAVQPQSFQNRLEAATLLYELLESAGLSDPARDIGLWAWLSLLLFDSVCPADGHGRRKPGQVARHIPDSANFRRYYRHLLAGPWRIFRSHRHAPHDAMVVLCQPLHKPGDIVEQLASRQELVTNRAFLAAATRLYIDQASSQPRRGAGSKSRGAPRRLADFCNQIDVTWDLYAMGADELLAKLPKEFDRFRRLCE
jgi:hypothetical protein